LQQLRFFTALAREKHFGRAAGVCQITQPTLSAGIKELERELGVALVERNARFVGLTPAGKRVLVWAARIVSRCDALSTEVGLSRTDVTGPLTLGIVPSAEPAAARLVDALGVQHPHVVATVLSCPASEVARGIDDGRFDAGISYLDVPWAATKGTAYRLYDERYVLIPPMGVVGPDRLTMTWRDAASMPLCLLDRRMQHRQLIDAAFATAGVAPKVRFEADSVVSVLSYVRHGRCGAIIPDVLLPLLDGWTGLRSYRLVEPEVRQTIGLLVPSRRPLPPGTAAFVGVAGTLDLSFNTSSDMC
jgi:DNA-binding transcriptional LysR family regulator